MKYNEILRQIRHLCIRCGNHPPIPTTDYCDRCTTIIDVTRLQINTLSVTCKKRPFGLCTSNGCGEDSVILCAPKKQPMCWEHWLKHKTSETRGLSKADWRWVGQLLVDQQFTCSYSGLWLIPGVNAGLDHIVPVSKGGGVKDNLTWCDTQVNRMKRDMSVEEFARLCAKVANYITYTN